jgi:hypothetical protein
MLEAHGLAASASDAEAWAFLRQHAAAGLTVALAQPAALAASGITVDAEAGVIRGASVMSIGEATGHGFEIDSNALDALVQLGRDAGTNGVKMHLGHPALFGPNPAESIVGRARNFRRDGDRVRADLHLASYAAAAPGGDRRRYLLAVADEDPSAIGLSVVARFDFEEQINRQTGETDRVVGTPVWLGAVDFVDDPAANRNGLLSTPAPGTNSPAGNPPGDSTMNPAIRNYLASKGYIAADATDAQVKQAVAALSGTDKQVVDLLQTIGEGRPTAEQCDQLEALGADLQKIGLARPQSGDDASATPASSSGSASTPTSGAAATSALTSGGGGGLSQADFDQRIADQLAADRRRHQELRNIAQTCHLGEDWVEQHYQMGTSADEARRIALEQLATNHPPVSGLSGHVRVGDDGREAFSAALADALILQSGGELYQAEREPTDPTHGPVVLSRGADGRYVPRRAADGAHDLAGHSLPMLCRRWLNSLGVADAYHLGNKEVFDLATDRMRLARHGLGDVALSHTTSDFTQVLGNSLNKMLLPVYEEEPSTWDLIGVERLVNDFRESKMVQTGAIGVPPRVLEGAEYTLGYISERHETIQAFKYGILLSMTWEMFMNDDLGAFMQGAFGFVQSARALENDVAWGRVTDNQTMAEDSTALFHSDHNNLDQGDGAAAMDIDTLADMRTAMRLQRALSSTVDGATQTGRRLNLRPNVLAVPVELEVQAEQLVASAVKPGGTNAEPNFNFVRSLQVVGESRLSDDSTTAHYLVAARNRSAPALVGAFLRGFRTPTIEQINTGSSVDGTTFKLRHVCGFKVGDYRAWQKNAGG